MIQPKPRAHHHPGRSLAAGLALLLACGSPASRAENLHAIWHGESGAVLVDRMLTALAEDSRNNRLLLSTGTEHLRSFLLQHLCLQSAAGCAEPRAVPVSKSPDLTRAYMGLFDTGLLLQQLNTSLQDRQLPQPPQQVLPQQSSAQPSAAGELRPLASL